ncbi:DUF2189 domain-containing protein [Pararhodospirillum oryzae]|uniref:Cytochrome c oxidase subunit I n=1 Tax=Pararhodospirillum oryzae TaxID=478448 RepID=A0A512H9J6_9PROT|nr:DUF2189 domain-containing protein [Pararhodospirillum oryzae]GEO82121.1 hypothetical protein ROR02_22520 [Pararhodospirillum oryzae]
MVAPVPSPSPSSPASPLSPPPAGPALAPLRGAAGIYHINRVAVRDVWGWLDRAWADICAAWFPSLIYGLLFVALGFAVTGGLLLLDLAWLVLPMAGAFLLVGPVLGIGLCEISRVVEEGGTPTLRGALTAFQRNGFAIMTTGVLFMLLMLAWVRVAALLFALMFPYIGGGWNDLIVQTLTTWDGAVFLLVGTAIGAGFALLAFVLGVVSLPLLLDRREEALRAAVVSFRAVQANPGPMAAWAGLIAVFIGAGLISAFIGLIPSLLLVGHATWHAYRALVTVEDPPEATAVDPVPPA